MAGHKTKIIVNADDYAISPEISRSILDLVEKKRISATSAMSVSPHWKNWGGAVFDYADDVDVGLHFSLTEFDPLSNPGSIHGASASRTFGHVMMRSMLGLIRPQDVRSEFLRQWDAFVQINGRAPSHVDGHQHVHQLPGVRQPLVSAIMEVGGKYPPYIRTCHEDLTTILRRGVCTTRAALFSVSGMQLERLAQRSRIPVNSGFSGIYNFRPGQNYLELMKRFLDRSLTNTILMCHPGQSDSTYLNDPIASARNSEYEYFVSPAYLEILNKKNIRLGRFSQH
jgi:chitin disaccharide deacetylase